VISIQSGHKASAMRRESFAKWYFGNGLIAPFRLMRGIVVPTMSNPKSKATFNQDGFLKKKGGKEET
jgi:hypothetical protein